jgi:hypothetical protein
MIVELLGPGGVGKTTLEPLVAARLGIIHYPALKRHGFEGEPLTPAQVWATRAGSALRSPRLLFSSLRAHRGTAKERLRFALDMCRRERIARRAADLGSGVVASGSIHALCAASANTDTDLTTLAGLITLADVYVRLSASPADTTGRLAARQGISPDELHAHAELQQSYQQYADSILQGLERPVVEVTVEGSPEHVADVIASRIER